MPNDGIWGREFSNFSETTCCLKLRYRNSIEPESH